MPEPFNPSNPPAADVGLAGTLVSGRSLRKPSVRSSYQLDASSMRSDVSEDGSEARPDAGDEDAAERPTGNSL